MGRMLQALRQIESLRARTPQEQAVPVAVRTVEFRPESRVEETLERLTEWIDRACSSETAWSPSLPIPGLDSSSNQPAAYAMDEPQSEWAAPWANVEPSWDTAVPETPPVVPLPSAADSRPDELPQIQATAFEELLSATEAEAALPPLARSPAPLQRSSELEQQLGDLCRKILLQFPGQRPTNLLFSSVDDSRDAASTVALLAAALTDRVPGEILAVDADSRQPQLADQLGVASSRGLNDVLHRGMNWRRVVQATDIPYLSVLPGQIPSPQPRQAGASNRSFYPATRSLSDLLNELRNQFRMVLVSAGSLLRADDASLLRCADGIYLLIRLGHADRRSVERAVSAIQTHGGSLMGAIAVEVA